MLAMLIVGFSGLVGAAWPSSAADTVPARRYEATPSPALHQADLRPGSPLGGPVRDDEAPIPRTFCSIRVLRADPSVDRGIVKALETPVDQEMVVPSTCAR
jgi:hypothetical protein